MAEVILTKNNKQLISYRVIKQEQDNSICSEKYCFLVPLEGNVLVAQKKEIFEMVPKDVLLIQPLTRYVLSTIHGVCLLYEVDFARMDVDLIEALNGVVCNSSLEKGKARYQWMIYYILRSLEPGKGEVSFITERKWLCQILEELLNKCTMDPGRAHHIQTEEQEILDYIGRHYKEQLSLSTLSTRFYVSKSSVSKMFKEKIGSSFLEYLTEIRMMHAVGYLQNPEKTIEQIAEENGFTNARSFSTKFQEYYQMLPSEYRKQRGIVCQESLQEEDSRYLSAFLEQIEGSLKGETHAPLPLKKQIIADVCVQQSVQLGNPDKIISINRAADLLIYQNYEIICQLVRNLGFRYIYFHEIFHSDMEIYITDRNGKPWLSFYKLDQLFDFVMECGLTPFVELSFLPRWMSGLDEPDTIRMESVAEMPRDMRQWKELVESVVRHLIARYGIREVLRWRFCIWNSPDNPDKIPMVSQPENYQKLYLETWRTLKQIHPDLQTGLPALMCFSLLHPSWMKAFSFFLQREQLHTGFCHGKHLSCGRKR